jgi:hypothetical protein
MGEVCLHEGGVMSMAQNKKINDRWMRRESCGDRLRRAVALSLVSSAATLGCGGEPAGSETRALVAAAQAQPNVDARRSLAITEQPIVVRFGLERVMDRIVATSQLPGLTSLGLFRQWWDTQNPGPGGSGPHCDDTTDAEGTPSLNGYPYTCRAAPAEGSQAGCDPFVPASPCAYIPIGLFMRFDLAPEDGSHCGEYRIVYGKQTGRTIASDRNLVIFEAALRNPHENQGIRGCRKFVQAWADLSDEAGLEARATLLERMYFDGFEEFDPVIQWSNFGDNPAGVGQVRTNQFMQPVSPKAWSLREFKIKRECPGGECTLHFVPTTDKVNPFGPLFDAGSTRPEAAAFQIEFLGAIARLAAPTLDGVGMKTSDAFNSGQSQASGGTETNYVANFGTGANAFRDGIQSTLGALGSTLVADDVVKRAQAMSCAGCHRLSNNAALGGGLTWPSSLGFTHVSERDIDVETVGGVARYLVSPALVDALLPRRKAIVEDFLNDVPHPARPPKDPLGGRWVH